MVLEVCVCTYIHVCVCVYVIICAHISCTTNLSHKSCNQTTHINLSAAVNISMERTAVTVKEDVGTVPLRLTSKGAYITVFSLPIVCSAVQPPQAEGEQHVLYCTCSDYRGSLFHGIHELIWIHKHSIHKYFFLQKRPTADICPLC